MFFKLHSERKIGYKLLSDADLGLSPTSHQTHIGLFDDIFTFKQSSNVEEESWFIYNNSIEKVYCYFNRIENPDGTFRSPKIRKGPLNSVSVVSLIRDKVNENPSYRWFLLWFGLQNEDMVFYLFNNQSEDYTEISRFIQLDTASRGGRVDSLNMIYTQILDFIEKKVNDNGKQVIEEMMIASQIGTTKQFRSFDLDNANNLFKEIGRKGEEKVNNYLDQLLRGGQIHNYTWYNKSRENGLPYDFTIQDISQSIVHLDVKSTSSNFEQPMIFSNQEIAFINNTVYYQIFRVYDLSDIGSPAKLRICNDSKPLVNFTYPKLEELKSTLHHEDIILQNVKLAISPTHNFLNFQTEIQNI